LFKLRSTECGFSLLELLIVLAIVGILSAIIYPNYQQAIIKTRHTEAKLALMDLANRMESYYLGNNHSYANASLAKLGVQEKTDKSFYKLSVKSTVNTYELLATATFSDAECYRFALNELGKKTSTNNMNICW
jgi:type IV pilus assembly protein PilE